MRLGPDQGNHNVVCPEVEREAEKENFDAPTIEVLVGAGNQRSKDRVKSKDWNNDQAMQSVHC